MSNQGHVNADGTNTKYGPSWPQDHVTNISSAMPGDDTATTERRRTAMQRLREDVTDKASAWLKASVGNERAAKIEGWVRAHPRMTAGLGVLLGAVLLRRLRH